jgi:protein adenylyltransferase
MQTLKFDNQFTSALPKDSVTDNVRRQIQGAIYAAVEPQQVSAPHLIAFAKEAAALIGLTEADCTSPQFVEVFSGNQLLPGMSPHATCYGGHQFGNWAGQLGDGRAINLGEVATPDGHYMLQLKGAGPTPFSRTADGLAVLRSSVREFLCSEAMHHLGVPTTRALSLIGTGEDVLRDMLYDGNAALEPGAVVCRMSSSFVRFGHFQMLTARSELELLKQFTDFVIQREFPHLHTAHSNDKERYIAWFNEICTRTAELMVHWMRVGFVHGVMNTDNMSIVGETIDYGPYGWLEDFDPNWTPNTTDAGQRRYRYSQQAGISQWNLMQLANAILPLVEEAAPLEQALSDYATCYESRWQEMMAQKLGLQIYDKSLVDNLLVLLTAAETDMTLFFRTLAQVDAGDPTTHALLDNACYQPGQLTTEYLAQRQQWLQAYHQCQQTQGVDDAERTATMNRTNPKYVLRNYLAQLAIDKAEAGDFELVNTLLDVLRNPYAEQPHYEEYAQKRPEWARTRVGCSMLSCSS